MTPPNVTMRKIAEKAGVSTMTVSRALRNDPRISQATKAKVNRISRDLGYRPDPRISELMSHLRRSQSKRARETIAFIQILPETETGAPLYTENREIAGLKERANELGLSIDTFDWAPLKLSTRALIRILHARGIRGAAILTRGTPPPDIDRLYEQFAVGDSGWHRPRTASCLHRSLPGHGAALGLPICEGVPATGFLQSGSRGQMGV